MAAGTGPGTSLSGQGVQVTDVDPRSDISLTYQEGDLHVGIPLDCPVTEMWSQRYEALAKAKGVQARVLGRPDSPGFLNITVPNKTAGKDVPDLMNMARAVIAEADAVDESPESSESPEAMVLEWWKRQRS